MMMNKYSICFVTILLVSWGLPAVGQSAPITDTLGPGDSLSFGQSIVSKNGDFRAVFQKEGNLVVYDRNGHVLWGSGTEYHNANKATMQLDGNLVINGQPDWATNTVGNPGSRLVMQDAGNLVIYNISGGAVWSSGIVDGVFWMKRHLETFGPTPLNQMVITGSHDAGMSMINGHTLFGTTCNTVTQERQIIDQLEHGIRYFDIRPVIGSPVIGNGGQLLTGHYGKQKIKPPGIPVTVKTWQGANGQSIASIVDQINNFNRLSNELIVLRISHDLNTDNNYRGFNTGEWERLFSALDGINDLYKEPVGSAGTLVDTRKLNERNLGDFILDSQGNPRSAVLLVFDVSNSNSALLNSRLGQGFYGKDSFPVFDNFADKNDVMKMASDQLQKMFSHSNEYFLLSWTLTQNSDQATFCSIGNKIPCIKYKNVRWVGRVPYPSFCKQDSILSLAGKANNKLNEKLIPYISKKHFPNIIYVDRVENTLAATTAMAINQFISLPLPASPQWILNRGDILTPGSQLETADGRFQLLMQLDGNLVLYQNLDGHVVWDSNTEKYHGAHAIMQNDGNLVIIDSTGSARWNSETENTNGKNNDNGGVKLVLQEDRNLVIYDAVGKAIWASNTDIPVYNRPPVAAAGAGQTVECTGASSANATLDGSASSDLDGDALTYAWSWLGGSASGVSPSASFPIGTTTVTLNVNDQKGHIAVATTTVTVVDTTAPTVNAGADITLEATKVLGSDFDVSTQVIAMDTCCAISEIISPAGPYPLGNTTVTVSATDCADNLASDSMIVTVQDTTPPILTVPADVSVEATGPHTAVSIGTATATDIFAVTITSDALATYALGTTVVTWTATDANANVSSGTQIVTVVDTTPPIVSAELVPVKLKKKEGDFRVEFSASDIVDANPSITAVLNGVPVTHSQIVELKHKKEAKVEKEHGELEISGLSFTLTVTATDSSSNAATASDSYTFPPIHEEEEHEEHHGKKDHDGDSGHDNDGEP